MAARLLQYPSDMRIDVDRAAQPNHAKSSLETAVDRSYRVKDGASIIAHDTLVSELPHRSVLRKLFRKLMRTDAELDAFCLDYFPEAHGYFADGMNRLSKVNLLLELTEPAAVLEGLRKWCKDTKSTKESQNWHKTINQALVAPESEEGQRRAELREKLEALYLQRERQRMFGKDFSQIDVQIVAIKRKQRQSPKLQEGEVLDDRYRLIEVIGKGGFGRVWQAFDRKERQLVAIKVLHVDQGDDPRRIERFIRGARQMKALEHRNIVRVLGGPAEYHGFHYFVMDYLPGGDLSQAVTTLAIDRAGALRAILAIGDALAYAHARHLIHRDIKPQNILLDGQGGARLTDFDLVWAADTTGGTATGFLGTHVYVAPEQAEDAKSVDERADVYALAMTTLYVLHGRSLPLHAVYKRALFIDGLECSEQARALLRQATAIEADDRPGSVAAYCRELSRCFASLLLPPLPAQPASSPRKELSEPMPAAVARSVGHSPDAVSRQAMAPEQRVRRISNPVLVALFGTLMLGGLGGSTMLVQSQQKQSNQEELSKRILEADSAIADRRWADAITTSDFVLSSPAASAMMREEASSRRARAESEGKTLVTYEQFLSSGDNYDHAVELYLKIPVESVYHSSARENYDKLFPLFVETHLKAAEDARAVGRCSDFHGEIKAILDIDPKQIKALATNDRPCSDKVVLSKNATQVASAAPEHHRTPRPVRESSTVATLETPQSTPPLDVSAAEADQILVNAQTEYVNGNFAQAVAIAKPVQHINPTRAWRIIGAAACKMRKTKLVSEAFKHLDSASRQYLVYSCQREGITNTSGSQFRINER